MLSIPRAVLQRLADLPEGKPSRLVINTNGRGEWKTETTVFDGCCARDTQVILAEIMESVCDIIRVD